MLGDTCGPGQAYHWDKDREMAKTSLLTVEAKHRIKLHGWALLKAAAAPAFQTQTLHETTGEAVSGTPSFCPTCKLSLAFKSSPFKEKSHQSSFNPLLFLPQLLTGLLKKGSGGSSYHLSLSTRSQEEIVLVSCLWCTNSSTTLPDLTSSTQCALVLQNAIQIQQISVVRAYLLGIKAWTWI